MRSIRTPTNAGFTLVEMAIVLVIIGFIIGGVLTAQQITQNAKITSTLQAIKSYQAAVQSYNQNYGALPGDDPQATARFNLSAGDGKGTIDGANYATNKTQADTEAQAFWQHLRAATLIKGAAADANLPTNPFAGVFGIQSSKIFTDGFVDGTNVICANKIPGAAAIAIDQQLDDGDPKTGSVRAGAATDSIDATALASSYESAKQYVLCTPL